MIRTLFWVPALALAVSACGDGTVGNTAANEAAGNKAVGSQAAQADGSASSSKSTPVPAPKAAAQAVGMPLGRPLGPLLDEDNHSPERMGCNAVFDGPEGRYLSVIDGELMVRTPAGRKLCPITDAQLQSLGEPGGEVSCAGVRIGIRETGARDSSIESDSSSAPAILSATQDGVTRTLAGDWGTAC
jgi:hypothetical protein